MHPHPDSLPGPVRPRVFPAADVLASLGGTVVFLSLCITAARACHLPTEAGIVTGVIGGLVVGLLGGSPLQVSGPAAGLIVLVVDFVDRRGRLYEAGAAEFDAAASLGAAVLLAGLMQVGVGWLRLGRWFQALSPAVILGMLAGVAFAVVARQVYVMVDDEPDNDVVLDLIRLPSLPQKAAGPGGAALLLGLLTLVILANWKRVAPRSLRVIPAVLVAVPLSILLADGFNLGVHRLPLGELSLERVRGLAPAALAGLARDPEVWRMALVIALIGGAEALLCATALDRIANGPRPRYDRELLAQGVGNVVCGALGALPLAGVIVRSSGNVQAGAKTRLSAALHGLWLVFFVALTPGLLRHIPTACVAAVLVWTAYKLVDFRAVRRLWRQSRGECVVAGVTAAAVVATNPLEAVLIGVALTGGMVAYRVSRLEVWFREASDGRPAELHLGGTATFARLPQLAEALDTVPPGRPVEVGVEGLLFVDHACLTRLLEWAARHTAAGGEVRLDWARLHERFETVPLARGQPG